MNESIDHEPPDRSILRDPPDLPDLRDPPDLPDLRDPPDLPDLRDLPDLPDLSDLPDPVAMTSVSCGLRLRISEPARNQLRSPRSAMRRVMGARAASVDAASRGRLTLRPGG